MKRNTSRRSNPSVLAVTLVVSFLALPATGQVVGVDQADSVTDPIGDTFGIFPDRIDITGLSAAIVGGDLVIDITFADAISPPGSGLANEIAGIIDIDTDQDGATGQQATVDLFAATESGLGVEREVDLFEASATSAPVKTPSDGAQVGDASLSFGADSMTITVSLLVLDDDGAVDLAGSLGTVAEPTDVVPNAGSVSSEPPPTEVLLSDDRFRIGVQWRRPPQFPDFQAALVSNLGTAETGIFYFLKPTNLELMVKVLNGCDITGHFWVFFAATTDVEFTLTVTDTQTNTTKQYLNPLGQPADAVTDTGAFATCP